ncbi:Do family serine endopeptidase [Polymorphum gilvum]|uniref:Probable periplasmic serine endoprotease DegP-like n=1 Tax=Polymorphum gilvum (strain LMG 25793 / CGMCC 1.9160 / SL003B-26A1) TaxID=991905 RepID=F2J6F1_POLGS|nr:Do family serine endopeptidase [Polymorphum gilvum]ADZ71325.1 Serine protease DO-like protease [Polymorphum gilvum SL003B-26A1]
MSEFETSSARGRLLASRRARLLAGVMALGLAGLLSAQTVVPQQAALADPVRVEAAAPLDFSHVVDAVQPAVVSVRVKQEAAAEAMTFGSGGFGDFFRGPGFDDLPDGHPLKRFFDRRSEDNRSTPRQAPRRYGLSQGSGFFISDDGYVVTNHHVIDKGTEFTVVDQDGEEYTARLIGADARTDLALLKVDAERTFTYVGFAEEAPRVGEWVVAIGNPFGLGGSVTAGIVSARGRDIGAGPYDDFIQIDAPVNRGNSGGPAFNMKGEVIGVNAAIFSPSGGNVGIAFAIPASTASNVVADLQQSGAVTRGWLGVQIQAVTNDIAESLGLAKAEGAIVAEAQDGSPADKAGLRSGDTILKVDGKPIKGPRDLSRLIAGYAPDTTVDVTVWRDGRERDIQVTLGTLDEPSRVAAADPATQGPTTLEDLGLGLTSTAEAGIDGDGVVVVDVTPGGPAAEKGLKRGDIIAEVAGEKVARPADVVEAIAKAQASGRKAVLMRVYSDRASRFVALPLKLA